MSLDADTVVDRRRLRRKLTFWRVAAVAIAVVAVVIIAAVAQRGIGEAGGAYIARVTISGLILGDTDRVEALGRLVKSTSARAVVIHVDSPGGTVAGSEQLFVALRGIVAAKPTVVVVDGLAASGGYIAALSGDHIVAQSTSLVGSIGVLFQYPNIGDLLDKLGVKVEEVKSSPLKAAPNGYEPTSPEARAALEAIVKDSYAWFRDIVKDRRHLGDDALTRVADGRVFTGRQALDLKLIDEVGNEKTAIDWLAKEKNIDPTLRVRDWQLHSRLGDLSFLHVAISAALEAMGFRDLARRFDRLASVQAIERLNLDGLLALWHPSAAD